MNSSSIIDDGYLSIRRVNVRWPRCHVRLLSAQRHFRQVDKPAARHQVQGARLTSEDDERASQRNPSECIFFFLYIFFTWKFEIIFHCAAVIKGDQILRLGDLVR